MRLSSLLALALLGCSTPDGSAGSGVGGAGPTSAASTTGAHVTVGTSSGPGPSSTVSSDASSTTGDTTSAASTTAASSSSTGVPSCEPTAAQQNAACLALPLPHNGCLTAFATGTGCGNAEPVLCDYYEPTTPPMPACVPDPNKWCRIPFSNKACPGSMM